MRRTGLMLLLLSGFVPVCRLQTDGTVRRFTAVNLKKTWTEAQSYCRDKFTDLATIQDPSDSAEAQRAAPKGKFWIGLYNSTWQWSQGDQDVQLDTWFTNWDTNEPRPGNCVTVSALGGWSARDCGAQHLFICYSAAVNRHILQTQLMTWSDAQTYCRSKYTDLSSIRSQEDNKQVFSLLQTTPDPVSTGGGVETGGEGERDDRALSLPPAAWIGLHRDFWVWSDRSGASYRRWSAKEPDVKGNCVTMESAYWFTESCDDKLPFLCHTAARPSAMRSVKVRMSGGSADLNNPVLQDSVLQQLKQKLEERGIREEVTLRWRRQPDGKVFHREEERAPPGDREEEDFCVTV